MITKVIEVNYDQTQNIYYTTLLDENGAQWIIEAHDNLKNQWLNVYTSDNATQNIEDDVIYGYEIIDN
jgi:hypothetical protein